MHRTRNAAYGQPYRGFESLPLRHFLPLLLKLPPKLAVERIGSAAAQRDGKADQSPEQRVFIAAMQPGKTVAPIGNGDDQELDRCSSREESGEQAENE